MTAFERLQIELDGIIGIINTYTHESNIQNLMNQLRKAVDQGNKEAILYCLHSMNEWYGKNMNVIASNRYVNGQELEGHKDNQKLIYLLEKQIESEDIPNFRLETEYAKKKTNIFLSHCSVDKKYGDALRNYIIGLGVPNESLIYTSHPMHKVPMDKNIYDYLREQISGNVFVIILWSNAYLDSPACLNEMGAAWVAQKDYTNIYVPDFDFGNPKYHQCAVDTRKMGAVLNGNDNCKASMIEFKQKIESLFELRVEEKEAQYLLDKFIEEISEG